ncbi:MAG: Type secretion system protein precursor [Planctomycetota bacterium]|jgi:prepilin-type N-terminal cleavage/methylation domain-containing protein
MVTSRPDRGFTLVELLTVMAIIATLAALGLTSIPAIIRNSQKTACQSNLQEIHKLLRIYEANNKRLPTASGSSFVLAVWGGQYLDKGVKEAELFFCPSTGRRPEPDLSNVTPEGIDFTGPEQGNRQSRNALTMTDRDASSTVIIANKVPEKVVTDEDKKNLPHKGYGICVLYLQGSTDFIDSEQFGPEQIPILGPDSPIEKLRWLRPGFDG